MVAPIDAIGLERPEVDPNMAFLDPVLANPIQWHVSEGSFLNILVDLGAIGPTTLAWKRPLHIPRKLLLHAPRSTR